MAEYIHDWEKKWKQITAEMDKKGKLLGRLRPSRSHLLLFSLALLRRLEK